MTQFCQASPSPEFLVIDHPEFLIIDGPELDPEPDPEPVLSWALNTDLTPTPKLRLYLNPSSSVKESLRQSAAVCVRIGTSTDPNALAPVLIGVSRNIPPPRYHPNALPPVLIVVSRNITPPATTLMPWHQY